MEIIFPWHHKPPTTPVPFVNNLIRSQNILTKLWLIFACPLQGTEALDIYGERSWPFRCMTLDCITSFTSQVMAIQMQHSHRLFLQSFMSKGILNSQEVRTLYNSATTRFGGWSPKWDTLSIMLINSLRPSDAIWRHSCGSTLAQVMACCLTAPSHYLNQCWLIINEVQWH